MILRWFILIGLQPCIDGTYPCFNLLWIYFLTINKYPAFSQISQLALLHHSWTRGLESICWQKPRVLPLVSISQWLLLWTGAFGGAQSANSCRQQLKQESLKLWWQWKGLLSTLCVSQLTIPNLYWDEKPGPTTHWFPHVNHETWV